MVIVAGTTTTAVVTTTATVAGIGATGDAASRATVAVQDNTGGDLLFE